ncbi:MAG: hypothetical protein II867_03680 [Clostridia bacterium]|nr:hypothetical protein [Clostridia bacterium]
MRCSTTQARHEASSGQSGELSVARVNKAVALGIAEVGAMHSDLVDARSAIKRRIVRNTELSYYFV